MLFEYLRRFAKPAGVLLEIREVGQCVVIGRDPRSDSRRAGFLQRPGDLREIFQSGLEQLFVLAKVEREAGLAPDKPVLIELVLDCRDIEIHQLFAIRLRRFVAEGVSEFDRLELVRFNADGSRSQAGEHFSRHVTTIANFGAVYFVRMNMRFVLVLSAASLWAETMPKGMRASTWVREDLFAGFLDNNMERFAKGQQKTDEIIAANPKAGDALAWRAGAELYLAVRASEAGDKAKFTEMMKKSQATFETASAVVAQIPQYAEALHAIRGGSYALFADRLPEPYRREGWIQMRADFAALREAQKAVFTKMPAHHQGEVLGGMAQAALRLGHTEEAKALLGEIVTTLPDSPYAPFAKRALTNLDAKAKVTCLSCHDGGRLANWKPASPPKAD